MGLSVWIVIGLLILTITYIYYIYDIAKGDSETSPNPVSWTVWGVISFGFFLILQSTGAVWQSCILPLMVSMFQLIIAGACFYKRRELKNPISQWEMRALFFALISVVLWYQLQSTYVYFALFCLTIGDICALIPSLKDAWNKPEEDNPIIWFIFLVVTVLAFIGMRELPWVNLLYPSYEMLIALAMASILFFRRQRNESLEN